MDMTGWKGSVDLDYCGSDKKIGFGRTADSNIYQNGKKIMGESKLVQIWIFTELPEKKMNCRIVIALDCKGNDPKIMINANHKATADRLWKQIRSCFRIGVKTGL